jgi:ribose-phosphate pyrophosphokinase
MYDRDKHLPALGEAVSNASRAISEASLAMSPCVMSPPESDALARAIARAGNCEWAAVEERQFAGEEFILHPLVPVRDRDICVVQTLAPTAEAPIAARLVRLLFLLAALRDAGARSRIAVIPYLAYARQERRGEACDPVHTRYVAELLQAAGMTHLIALDVHDLAALDNAFRVPVEHLTARPIFIDWLAEQPLSEPLAVASPDIGGIKRAQLFREHLERRLDQAVELLFIEKRRTAGHLSGHQIVGQAEGRHVLLIDDLCATGETLMRAAAALHHAGALRVSAAVTHVANAAGLRALCADPHLTQVLVTDSALTPELRSQDAARDKLCVIPCASLFAPALAQIGSR